MLDDWKGFLLRRTAEWGLPGGDDWKCLFHNNYHPHHSNINLLWFHGKDLFPRVAAKLYRDPEVPVREFENVTKAYRYAPQCIPKPLYCGCEGGVWMFWMQGMPGWRQTPSGRGLEALADTIASMHCNMRGDAGQADANRWKRTVAKPLAALVGFGTDASVVEGCARIAESASERWLDTLPAIPQHGDLYADNTLSHRGRWYIVDWESFGIIDLPFYDLFTLLYSVFRTRGETPDKWDSSLVRQAPEVVRKYACMLDIPMARVPLLLPLAFANWFHLHWLDGRKEFATRMYSAIRHYFEHTDRWNRAFLGD